MFFLHTVSPPFRRCHVAHSLALLNDERVVCIATARRCHMCVGFACLVCLLGAFVVVVIAAASSHTQPLSVVCLCVRVCPCVVVRSCLVRLLVRRALLGARVCLAFILDTGGRLSSCRRRLPPCLSALAVCVGWLALGSLRVRACVRVLAPRRGVLSASPLVAPAGLP